MARPIRMKKNGLLALTGKLLIRRYDTVDNGWNFRY
jgi:hypothetical protein